MTEYLPEGDLKNLCLNIKLTPDMMLSMFKDVASGMNHIHVNFINSHFSHLTSLPSFSLRTSFIVTWQLEIYWFLLKETNTSSRFVNSQRMTTVLNSLIQQVADFGLSRITESGIYDATNNVSLPVKWSSPEVLLNSKFSKASDVWSFGIKDSFLILCELLMDTFSGVVMWEVVERSLPYVGMTNREVIEEVCKKKYRLPKPAMIQNCSEEVVDQLYSLMMSCWESEPSARPTFEEMCTRLNSIQKQLGLNPANETLHPEETTTALTVTSEGGSDYYQTSSNGDNDGKTNVIYQADSDSVSNK